MVAGKAAVGQIDPYALMVLRWTGALLLLLPFAIGPLQRDWPTIRAKWWLYLFYGAVGYATFNVPRLCRRPFYLRRQYRSRPGDHQHLRHAVQLPLVPDARPPGATDRRCHHHCRRGADRDPWRSEPLLALDINFGDLLVLFACLAYAIYSISLRWRPPTNWLSFLFASFSGAVLASIVFQIIFGGGIGHFIAALPTVTPLGWIIVIYTVIFPSLISQMFYVRGVELIGANRASLFINLIPLFGAVGSVLVLGEQLQGFHLIAGALVIVGIVLAEWSARRG